MKNTNKCQKSVARKLECLGLVVFEYPRIVVCLFLFVYRGWVLVGEQKQIQLLMEESTAGESEWKENQNLSNATEKEMSAVLLYGSIFFLRSVWKFLVCFSVVVTVGLFIVESIQQLKNDVDG